MLTGLLIAFVILLVIGVAIGLVLIIVYWEISPHIYEGFSTDFPTRRFRAFLPTMSDLFPEEIGTEEKEESSTEAKKAPRHIHYHE